MTAWALLLILLVLVPAELRGQQTRTRNHERTSDTMATRNYAGMTKVDLHAVIAKAKDAKVLDEIDYALSEAGYSKEGVARMLVANRKAVLAGNEPPHVIPTGAGLPPIRGSGKFGG